MKLMLKLREPLGELVPTSLCNRALIFAVILVALFLSVQKLDFAMSYNDMSSDMNADGDSYLVSGVEHGSLSARLGLLSLGALACCSLVGACRGLLVRLVSENWLMACFVAFAVCSILWADDPVLTLRRVVELGILYLAALVLALRVCRRNCIQFAFWGSALYLAIGVGCELYLRTFAPLRTDYRFCGTQHPNHQAWNCALLVLSALVLSHEGGRSRNWYRIAAFVGFSFLVLTKSRTSIVCLILAGAVVAFLRRSHKQQAAIVLALFSAVLFIYVYQYDMTSSIPKFVMASRGNASNYDLTGRVPLWEGCLSFASDRPLLGYGFEGFWNPPHIEQISSDFHLGVVAAHNGYIDLVLSVGIIGLLLYASYMSKALVRALRLYRATESSEWAFASGLLVFYAATMVTEAITFDRSLTTLIVFVVMMWRPTTQRTAATKTALCRSLLEGDAFARQS